LLSKSHDRYRHQHLALLCNCKFPLRDISVSVRAFSEISHFFSCGLLEKFHGKGQISCSCVFDSFGNRTITQRWWASRKQLQGIAGALMRMRPQGYSSERLELKEKKIAEGCPSVRTDRCSAQIASLDRRLVNMSPDGRYQQYVGGCIVSERNALASGQHSRSPYKSASLKLDLMIA